MNPSLKSENNCFLDIFLRCQLHDGIGKPTHTSNPGPGRIRNYKSGTQLDIVLSCHVNHSLLHPLRMEEYLNI